MAAVGDTIQWISWYRATRVGTGGWTNFRGTVLDVQDGILSVQAERSVRKPHPTLRQAYRNEWEPMDEPMRVQDGEGVRVVVTA